MKKLSLYLQRPSPGPITSATQHTVTVGSSSHPLLSHGVTARGKFIGGLDEPDPAKALRRDNEPVKRCTMHVDAHGRSQRLITVGELAAMTQLNRHTIYGWLYAEPGRLPRAIRLGRSIRFMHDDVDAWLQAHKDHHDIATSEQRSAWQRPRELVASVPSRTSRHRGSSTRRAESPDPGTRSEADRRS